MTLERPLMQPWPLKCIDCGSKWGSIPLIVICLGASLLRCPKCMSKLMNFFNMESTDGVQITFNNWRRNDTKRS